jgi:hypothetical protein
MVLPRAVVFGEALTELVHGTPGQWKGLGPNAGTLSPQPLHAKSTVQ